MAQPYLGEIIVFAGNFAPQGYLFCDGALLAISENDALFVILGTTYGGDGQTTFALPDLRGRLPLHAGQLTGGGSYPLGARSGTQTVTLTTNQLPSHTHPLTCTTNAGSAASPSGAFWAQAPATPGVRGGPYSDATPTVQMNANAIGLAGGSQPHDNVQPILGLNFCIATQGVFPTQS